ncbi:MAG: lipoate--protein ligase family protein [bacterium]|nr:lipoate--protein ligase family protein [bacterium]
MPAPWRLITTYGAPPDFNMGLDEALLELGERPTLRIYTWSPDTLSLGYFQKLTDVPDRDKASHLVRRITGGGAIHHTGELTFSITTDASDPLYRGNVGESYDRIHKAVIQALSKVGVEAQLACHATTETIDSGIEHTGMCFHKSTPQDILWANKKGVGSAQRRRKGRVLHHGSIKVHTSDLEGNIATLSESSTCTDPGAFAPHLIEAFKATLGLTFERTAPGPVELEHAAVLGPRYSAEEFLSRR